MDEDVKTFLYLLLLALQFGFQPLLFGMFVNHSFPKTLLILMAEGLKVLLAGIPLLNHKSEVSELVGFKTSFVRAGLPAALFSLQNWLILYGNQRMSGLTLSLLNQTKTLSAALFAYLLLGKKQTNVQIVALFGILLGGTIVIHASEKKSSSSSTNIESDMAGIFAVSFGKKRKNKTVTLTQSLKKMFL